METGRIGLMLAVAVGMAATAEAGPPAGAFGGFGPVVRDHRTPPVVRDHRIPTPPPVVRDHRIPTPPPVVRDHRIPPVVRDHRTPWRR